MPPDGGNRFVRRVGDQSRFGLAIGGGEIQIGGGGHDQGWGLDGAHCPGIVPLKEGGIAHITAEPGIDHGNQIVGVALAIIRLPTAQQIVLQRVIAKLEIELFSIVGLGCGPTRVDAGIGLIAAIGGCPQNGDHSKRGRQ